MRDAIRRAERAKALLEDDLLTEALDAMRDEAVETWARSEPGEADKREEAYRQLRAVDQFRDQLRRVLDNGIYAAHRIGADTTLNKRNQ